MFKVKNGSQFEDPRYPFGEKKGIILGIILGKKVSFLLLFVTKNVPFLDKNGLKRYLYFFKMVPTGTYKSPDETLYIPSFYAPGSKLILLLESRFRAYSVVYSPKEHHIGIQYILLSVSASSR